MGGTIFPMTGDLKNTPMETQTPDYSLQNAKDYGSHAENCTSMIRLLNTYLILDGLTKSNTLLLQGSSR